jgi:carbamoyl-phosphate synthase / aspartate carbamoyltransferase
VTNVKNCKLLIEAIGLNFSLDVSSIDFKTSRTEKVNGSLSALSSLDQNRSGKTAGLDGQESLLNSTMYSPQSLQIPMEPAFRNQNILSISKFNRRSLHTLYATARAMRIDLERGPGVLETLKGRILALAFFEASTRTSVSFHAAMERLGKLHDLNKLYLLTI